MYSVIIMVLDKKKLAAFIKDQYGVDVESMKSLYAYADINLKLTASDQNFFLKIDRHQDIKTVRAITTMMGVLAENGIPIAKIRRSLKGDDVVPYKNMSCLMQNFVVASLLEDVALSHSIASEVGKTLGQIHKIDAQTKASVPLQDALAIPSPWNPDDFDLALAHGEKVRSRIPGNLKSVIADLAKEWRHEKHELSQCRRGYIHNDFNATNIMVKKSRIAAIIDFSASTRSWYAADVATALQYLFVNDKQNWPLIGDFIVGYETAFALTDVEKAAIPLLIKTRAATGLIEILRDHHSIHENAASMHSK
jgi:Ser/Thr protein kinase RdoA (MazF antagonist)